jgi:hypothetical protein
MVNDFREMTSLSQNPLIQYSSQFIVMPFIILLLVDMIRFQIVGLIKIRISRIIEYLWKNISLIL